MLINDATIGSLEFPRSPLKYELDRAVATGSHLMVCVNRGILVEELAEIEEDASNSGDDAGVAVLNWVAERSPVFATKESWWIDSSRSINEKHLRAGSLNHGDGVIAELLVVFVDVHSLLEPAPIVRIDDQAGLDVESTPYKVTQFDARRAMPHRSVPAGTLVADVVGEFEEFDLGGHIATNPFFANIKSLRAESCQAGLLSTLRAAEIVSGQRMTYREVWGAISRVFIGDAHLDLKRGELEAALQSMQPRGGDGVRLVFDRWRKLASYRYFQSLFGAGSSFAEVDRDPVLRMTTLVDPVKDAVPGTTSESGESGWASPIADAFIGDADNISPLRALIEAAGSAALSTVVTEFEESLDAAYIALLEDGNVSERERAEATGWYGAYLTRLYAASEGIPAFQKEVAVWTTAWGMAPNIPQVLDEQLGTLLEPVRYPAHGRGAPLFPLFESRTNPVRGDLPVATLAIRSKDVTIESETDSDALFVSVREPLREPITMLLDFAMIREAMACAGGYSGASELSGATSPRLERFRAARLVPGAGMGTSNYRLVVATSDFPVTVEDIA